MLPASCRYYPTCSEYAKWLFDTTSPHKAFFDSSLRILRCNQLFDGGIEYPIITYFPPHLVSLTPTLNYLCGKIKIQYWFVPKINTKNKFYVIKDYNA